MNLRTPVVLLVEDDASVLNVMRRILEKLGCSVLTARSAEEALDICHSHLPLIDLLLSDLVLPGKLNGHHLAVQLQSRKPELRVVFTSGHQPDIFASEVDLREGINFLGKPYSALQLESLLTRLTILPSEKLTTPDLSPTLG